MQCADWGQRDANRALSGLGKEKCINMLCAIQLGEETELSNHTLEACEVFIMRSIHSSEGGSDESQRRPVLDDLSKVHTVDTDVVIVVGMIWCNSTFGRHLSGLWHEQG